MFGSTRVQPDHLIFKIRCQQIISKTYPALHIMIDNFDKLSNRTVKGMWDDWDGINDIIFT